MMKVRKMFQVWCDQKKYVRHKAAQNLKLSRGTGGGPNMEQKFSTMEEAIYALIGMKESVEGVANTFGLGSSSTTIPNPQPNPESVPTAFAEFLVPDDEVVESIVFDTDTPEKPPAKKMRTTAQNYRETQGFSRDVLTEEISIQKKMLEAMMEQQQNTKKLYRSVDRLYDLKKEELKEQKRHNMVMENLRLKEVENNIEYKKRR